MSSSSQVVALRTVYISRAIFYTSISLGFCSALFLLISYKQVEIFAGLLFIVGGALMAISWGSPAVLILFGLPWLAYAWFVGMKPFGHLAPSWEELPKKEKFAVYANSIISFLALVAILIVNIINKAGK